MYFPYLPNIKAQMLCLVFLFIIIIIIIIIIPIYLCKTTSYQEIYIIYIKLKNTK